MRHLGNLFGSSYGLTRKSTSFEWCPNEQAALEAVWKVITHPLTWEPITLMTPLSYKSL